MPPAAGKAVELVHEAWSTPGFTLPALVELPVHSYPDVSLLVEAVELRRSSKPVL
jgi:hypothetical protein